MDIEDPKVIGYLDNGKLPCGDDSSIDTAGVAWERLQVRLKYYSNAGQTFSSHIVSTYGLLVGAYPTSSYMGGVLDANGYIHFTPDGASVGQKVSPTGAVSTYSIICNGAGGVLAPDGSLHFGAIKAVPSNPIQTISASGVVSTYASVGDSAYWGAIVVPNGDIHWTPSSATVGMKRTPAGVMSTYALLNSTTSAYMGGVLAPNGDLHFVPNLGPCGMKLSAAGVMSTYSILATGYLGGVVALNGDVHFIPTYASVGQKISLNGVVSTYSWAYTSTYGYSGGVLAPNGEIHLVPHSCGIGQKLSVDGVASTYSLLYTALAAYTGGVLNERGEIHFIPQTASVGQKITFTTPPWSRGICCSPFFNKL